MLLHGEHLCIGFKFNKKKNKPIVHTKKKKMRFVNNCWYAGTLQKEYTCHSPKTIICITTCVIRLYNSVGSHKLIPEGELIVGLGLLSWEHVIRMCEGENDVQGGVKVRHFFTSS